LGLALLGREVFAEASAEQDGGHEKEEENTTAPYEEPSTAGLHWAETFDGDVWSRWKHSLQEKYTGKFTLEKRAKEALLGDVGLLVPTEARHYGAAATFAPIQGKKEVPFVVQFEVRFQDGLQCGGSYIKLFDSSGAKADEFKDNTPYVIMFGPDRCGETDKVHFILRHKNPISGTWGEKHFKDAPRVPSDQTTHLYGLVIKPDNSFDILIDGEVKKTGNLLTSMEPAVNPPKVIDDPADSKPSDWVDEAKIDDPSASKPDDWDEDAPARLPDPAATMPAGWREDQQKKIPDPTAKQPDDWDPDEDGDWEAPVIENPACKVGCGKWEPPTIANPQYKGKWHAPRIDNPAYKGIWKPRQIDNPNYFVDEAPYLLPTISAVGIDIWTMQKGIIFDNIIVATDPQRAQQFGEDTWKVRHQLELKQIPPLPKDGGGDGLVGEAIEFVTRNIIPVGVTLLALAIGLAWFCLRDGSGVPPPPSEAERRRLRQEREEARKEQEGATAAPEQDGAAAAAAAEQEDEGGLGDLGKTD